VSEKKVVAIIQARMASTRLPGKVLAEIEGEPMLIWVVERARLAQNLTEVVVATTTDPKDDAIFQLCKDRGILVHRGNPVDVLDRYWETANAYGAEIIVRITADCPLIDPGLIDLTVEALLDSDPQADFAANRLPWQRTYPIGLDVEVCTLKALKSAWHEAGEPHHREHVMPYLYENPDRFRILHLQTDPNYGSLRWTVDTQEDLEFVREVTIRLPGRAAFSWRDVLEVLEENPELEKINANVEQKTHRDVG
jgi:spore coat polysaccharide biosynthesis protein SpsF